MSTSSRQSNTGALAAATTALLGLLGVVSCADPSSAPRMTSLASPQFSVAVSKGSVPRHFPNTVKYSDTGKHPATGRSGSATLTTRALLSKDGSTQLEITTGALDAGTTPPGNLKMVQLQQFDPNGTQIGTTVAYPNLNSGGYASFTLPGLSRGFQIQTHANITGIDPRTDVAIVTTGVVLRPDLAVTAFKPPQIVFVNTPLTLTATVQELNGDVGARANCVLYVDGTAVDKATNIWVDAKGTVTCAFMTTFTTTGVKQLKVAVENVTPGDWDLANNTATASINVVASGGSTLGYAYDGTFSSGYTDNWSWDYGPDPNGAKGHGEGTWENTSGSGHVQGEGFFARVSAPFVQQGTLTFTASSGGNTLYTQTLNDLGPPAVGGARASLSATVTSASGSPGTPTFVTTLWTLTVNGASASDITPQNPTGAWMVVIVRRDAGAATFLSATTGKILFDADANAEGSWTVTAQDASGNALTTDPLTAYSGTDITLQAMLSSSAGTTITALQIPLISFDVTGTPPFTPAACTPMTIGLYTWKHCYTNQNSHLVGRGGWGVGQPGSFIPVQSGGWF